MLKAPVPEFAVSQGGRGADPTEYLQELVGPVEGGRVERSPVVLPRGGRLAVRTLGVPQPKTPTDGLRGALAGSHDSVAGSLVGPTARSST